MQNKIFALLASPRKNGNSEILLDEALKKIPRECIVKVRICQLQIQPCQSCGYCQLSGRCKIKDDFHGLIGKMLNSQSVIIASPIYFYHLPSQFKAFIDRSQSFWSKKYLLKQNVFKPKNVYTILVGATVGKKLFLGSQLSLKYFYDIYNLCQKGELLVRGVDKKSPHP